MTRSPDVHTIATTIHGRYLVRTPDNVAAPWPLLVGFHGYGENAERHLAALARLPGSDRWLIVSVQALHPFYTREQAIVASWMTRQDRDLAIEDNIRYVGAVVAAVRRENPVTAPTVYEGFSQGAAMAYRAGAHHGADAVIALAGDVPPDVAALARPRFERVLIGRGSRDESYTAARHDADIEGLHRLGVEVESCVFDGGHEWTAEFYRAAGDLLARVAVR